MPPLVDPIFDDPTLFGSEPAFSVDALNELEWPPSAAALFNDDIPSDLHRIISPESITPVYEGVLPPHATSPIMPTLIRQSSEDYRALSIRMSTLFAPPSQRTTSGGPSETPDNLAVDPRSLIVAPTPSVPVVLRSPVAEIIAPASREIDIDNDGQAVSVSLTVTDGGEPDKAAEELEATRRARRRLTNQASARAFRARNKNKVEDLQGLLDAREAEVARLQAEVARLMEENAALSRKEATSES